MESKDNTCWEHDFSSTGTLITTIAVTLLTSGEAATIARIA